MATKKQAAALPPACHQSFLEMTQELLEHPRIDVTHLSGVRKFSATGKSAWSTSLDRNKRRVPKGLAEVATALGGFMVRWNLLDAPAAKKRKPSSLLYTQELEQPPFATGCINLTHVVEENLDGIIAFDTDSDDTQERVDENVSFPRRTFRRSLRRFDAFDNYYSVAFLDGEKTLGRSGFVLGIDAYANFDARLVDPETYLHLLRVTRGCTDLRVAYFQRAWELPANVPPLDEIIDLIASRKRAA